MFRKSDCSTVNPSLKPRIIFSLTQRQNSQLTLFDPYCDTSTQTHMLTMTDVIKFIISLYIETRQVQDFI